MLPRLGLRGRLAVSLTGVVVLAFAVTFVAVERGTGSALRNRIDDDLRASANGLAGRLAAAGRPSAAVAAARRYIAGQPFGPSARLLVFTPAAGPSVTNHPELLNPSHEHEHDLPAERSEELRDAEALRSARSGFTVVKLPDADSVRLLTLPIAATGRFIGLVRAGEPLQSVERAESELTRIFGIAAAATLALALAAIYLLTGRTTTPLLERLEDAFRRQRAFVSDASHELRTPLTALRGQLEVLAREPDPSPDRVREVERLALREIERMQHLVDELLMLARLDERAPLARETIQVEPFLEELVEGWTGVERRIELAGVPAGTLAGEPHALARVIGNLIRNAIDHTEDGGRIVVEASAAGDRLRVSVDDDGPGIPAAERRRVFDRFHRGEESRSRRLGGSGLGLAIVSAIVEAHGGRIWVEGSPLGGARLVFELPGLLSPPSRRAGRDWRP